MANRITLASLCQPKVATLPNDFDDLIDYIDISSVDNESKTIIAHQEVDAKDAPSRARQLLQVGDVIVSTVRPNLNAVALVESAYENTLVGSTGYCVLRAKDGVDNRFVFYFCQSPYFVEDMTAQATGASYPAVTASIVRNSTLPAYTLEEQHEIAQHLDTVSTLISLRQQQIAKLDELVKARFVEMFGDPALNPHGYPIKYFDEMSILITDGEHATPRRTTHGIYLLSARNVLNHCLQLDDVDYIDEEEYARIARRVVPQKGDVLISCSGSIGRCCVVPDGMRFQMVRSAALIRFNAAINPTFAEWLITSDELQRQIAQSATQSSQANLFQGKIQKLRGYVPPLDLQEQFASFVVQTDQQKSTIQQSLAQLELLKKALMQKYFG